MLRLLGCKRPRDAFAALPTFCGSLDTPFPIQTVRLFSFGKDSSPPCKSSVTSGHGPAFADREGKRQFPQGLELELEPTPKRDTASELTLTYQRQASPEGMARVDTHAVKPLS